MIGSLLVSILDILSGDPKKEGIVQHKIQELKDMTDMGMPMNVTIVSYQPN
jgi:hypothetical protein